LWDWLEESILMVHGVPDEVCSLTSICQETWWVQNSYESNLCTQRNRSHVVPWINSGNFCLPSTECGQMSIADRLRCKEIIQDNLLETIVEQTVPYR
jgi:hypothetical protein